MDGMEGANRCDKTAKGRSKSGVETQSLSIVFVVFRTDRLKISSTDIVLQFCDVQILWIYPPFDTTRIGTASAFNAAIQVRTVKDLDMAVQ